MNDNEHIKIDTKPEPRKLPRNIAALKRIKENGGAYKQHDRVERDSDPRSGLRLAIGTVAAAGAVSVGASLVANSYETDPSPSGMTPDQEQAADHFVATGELLPAEQMQIEVPAEGQQP